MSVVDLIGAVGPNYQDRLRIAVGFDCDGNNCLEFRVGAPLEIILSQRGAIYLDIRKIRQADDPLGRKP
jgi:hypothetical protein